MSRIFYWNEEERTSKIAIRLKGGGSIDSKTPNHDLIQAVADRAGRLVPVSVRVCVPDSRGPARGSAEASSVLLMIAIVLIVLGAVPIGIWRLL